jgi:hypothetical protein
LDLNYSSKTFIMPKRSSKDDKTPSKRSRRDSGSDSGPEVEEVEAVTQAAKGPEVEEVEAVTQAAKSAMKRTPLWKNFTLLEDWVPNPKASRREQYRPAKCNHCDAVMTRIDGNTTNLRNHLKKHPNKWAAYLKDMKDSSEEKVS